MNRTRSAGQLPERLAALDEALSLAEGRAEPSVLDEVRTVRARADERLARGDGLVVVAFAGGTGTGKSSLFNAVAGERIAETGVTRPVTAEPQALVVGDLEHATPLLDWLDVRRRHVTGPDGLPEGLVLVDLPDHDSVERSHRQISDRFVERVDHLIWVVDPLKYSRRDLHHAVLRPLTAHARVLHVVLNHADVLSPDGRRACFDDLKALLAAEGLGEATVLLTSARTGEGIDRLRRDVVKQARQRRAAADRIAADVSTQAARLREHVLGAVEPTRTSFDTERLVSALAAAGGVTGRVEAAAGEYRGTARRATRPLGSAWVAALWALVMRMVRTASSWVPRAGRTGLAATAEQAAPSAVQHAILELAEEVAGALPRPAREALHVAAGAEAESLSRAVGRAVDTVGLRPPRRAWWLPVRVLLSLAELAAAVGFGWLMLAWLVDWLRLPELPMPAVAGELPWATALLLGGLAVRVLGGVVRRRAVLVGAARHGQRVRDRLRAEIARVAAEQVEAPIRAELDALVRLDDALRRAAA